MEYFVLNKPFGYLSQFTDEGNRPGLGQILDVPNDVYPVGRLDADSEGLLLLTNDKAVNSLLLDPDRQHARTYWVQVEGSPTNNDLQAFERPLNISIRKKPFRTRPAKGDLMDPPEVWERNPPVRVRKTVPDSWIAMTLVEGKNRQVRKMTAAIGFPTLRLIRWSIEDLELGDLPSGQVRAISREDAYRLLQL